MTMTDLCLTQWSVGGLFLGPHAAGVRSGVHAGPLTSCSWSWSWVGTDEPMGSDRSYTGRISGDFGEWWDDNGGSESEIEIR